MEKQEMIDYIKLHHGFEFPMKAKYKRTPSRIYFAGDFEDGEEVEFWWMCDKPSSMAKGYAYYSTANKPWKSKLIHINELEKMG